MLSLPNYNYEVLVLDSRTWRAYPGKAESFPALLSQAGFSQQLPINNVAAASKLLLVIRPIGRNRTETHVKAEMVT